MLGRAPLDLNPLYEVRDTRGSLVWEGTADCKWDARAKAIMAWLVASAKREIPV